MNAFKDPASTMRMKMSEDRIKIGSELKLYKDPSSDPKEGCMVKFEIQAL